MIAILTSYDCITGIQVAKQCMTLKKCVVLTESMLDNGYKPIEGFRPESNEGYTNGKYRRMWRFIDL